MLLFSRQGKLRLQKWYAAHPDKAKKKITRDLVNIILARKPKHSSFVEWQDLKIVYKRLVLAGSMTNTFDNSNFRRSIDMPASTSCAPSSRPTTSCSRSS